MIELLALQDCILFDNFAPDAPFVAIPQDGITVEFHPLWPFSFKRIKLYNFDEINTLETSVETYEDTELAIAASIQDSYYVRIEFASFGFESACYVTQAFSDF